MRYSRLRNIHVAGASALATLLIAPLALRAQEGAVPAAPAGPEAPEELTDQELQAFGWIIGQNAGLMVGYSEEELEQIFEGMRQAAQGAEEPENFRDELLPNIQAYVRAKQAEYQAQQAEVRAQQARENLVKTQERIDELKEMGLERTESGTFYKIENEGEGEKPTPSDRVVVHYHGTLQDGTVFDSTRDGEPVEFPIGGVVPGFREGLMLLGKGGKATLHIPPDAGYGAQGTGPIPGNAMLTFDVEVVEIKDAPQAPPPNLPQGFDPEQLRQLQEQLQRRQQQEQQGQ